MIYVNQKKSAKILFDFPVICHYNIDCIRKKSLHFCKILREKYDKWGSGIYERRDSKIYRIFKRSEENF